MFVNNENLVNSLSHFGDEGPFDHCVIDDFFEASVASGLEKEFPKFESSDWYQYNSPIEVKKLCNNWNLFPALPYQVFNYLNSSEFTNILEKNIFDDKRLLSDVGLNGGGWHIHKAGGKLNTHLDYSIHPKLGLHRKLNIIVYLNSNWQSSWGGNLGLWSNESNRKPGSLVKEIEPKFNRAVLFDTTQNSWHGLPKPISCPANQFRKSMAVYYLCDPDTKADLRGKALFAPTKEQSKDPSVLQLIRQRAKVSTASDVWKT